MWMALIPLLSSLFGENGPIGSYLKTQAAKVQAQAELDLQVEKDKLALSTAMAQAQVESEANKLNATSQGFKAFSYALLTFPIIVVCLLPNVGKDIFANLSLIPSWYAQLYVAISGVIWGLPIASSAVNGIFSSVQQAWIDRQPHQIAKIKAVNENILAEQLRQNLFKNGMTQAQWDAILNAANSSIQDPQ